MPSKRDQQRRRAQPCPRCGLVLVTSTKVERYHALCAARLALARGLELHGVCKLLDVGPLELAA